MPLHTHTRARARAHARVSSLPFLGPLRDVIDLGCPAWEALVVITNNSLIEFGAGTPASEPRRMTSRLASKLELLAELVARDARFAGQ